MSKKRIGVFGGTFDPFTQAHRAIVDKVLEDNLVDEIIIVPTIVNYYRDTQDRWLTDQERIEVIRCMLSDRIGRDVFIDVNEIDKKNEYHRGNSAELFCRGRRFFHTLVDIHEGYHDDELYTIIGTDQYSKFDSWFMAQDILRITQLIVINGRNGEYIPIPEGVFSTSIAEQYEGVSASEIRNQYKNSCNAVQRYMNGLPPANDIIIQHTPIFDLVQKPMIQKGFSPVGINAPDWITVIIRNTDSHRLLMVSQTRYGTMKEYEEFVCGQVEKDEAPIDTAIREVKEETGIDVSRGIEYLESFDTNPAFMSNKMHYFLAEVTQEDVESAINPTPDEHEHLTLTWEAEDAVNTKPGGPTFRRLAVELLHQHDREKHLRDKK